MTFFCASQSRDNRESIFGTVALIRSWWLLEYPSVWRRHAVEDSRLISPKVKAHLRASADRTLLVRQEHFRSGALSCFYVDSSEEAPRMTRYSMDDYEGLPGVGQGEVLRGPMFAVCTHSRHDKCCAKFGIPVSCAFRDLAGERAWQCSHVGGDRFAGNVVVFPYGMYYGRVTAEDVPEIIRRTDRGEVWLPGYRGRSCYPRAAQVGEYFVRVETGRLGLQDFVLTDIQRSGERTRVEFAGRADGLRHVVQFSTRDNALRQRLTCHAEEESPIAQYELRTYNQPALLP